MNHFKSLLLTTALAALSATAGAQATSPDITPGPDETIMPELSEFCTTAKMQSLAMITTHTGHLYHKETTCRCLNHVPDTRRLRRWACELCAGGDPDARSSKSGEPVEEFSRKGQ